MTCGQCGFENRADARFCRECGAGLALACPACAAALPPGTKFCDACGAAVAGRAAATPAAATPPAAETRKVVTLVFADLAGSTSLQEQMDPESARRVMDRFYGLMTEAITTHGGRVVKVMGDGVMAAFGVPEVQEDDAVRAVRAAAAMHDAFASLDVDKVGLRIGVNTGEVVVSEGDDDVVGDAVNVAARLEHAAAEGDVLIGDATWRLVRDLMTFEPVAPLELKGKAEPVPAYRLVSAHPQATATTAAPFVGRHAELERLIAAFDTAITQRTPQLAVVIGSPGLGKSRLAAELVARVAQQARILEARCDPNSTSAYAPLTDVVSALSEGTDDPELLRITESLLGVGAPATPQETFWAVRRLLENAAARQPTVLMVDDVHWAEPLLLDLIEHVVEWGTDAPLLVVALARPELRETRAALAERNPIVLTGLDDSASAQLLGDLPSDLAARFLATAEGNPLYLRELLRMVADDGVDNVDVPPTIQALLAARIERLHANERAVVERASVVGQEFYRGAVVDLVSPAVGGAIDTHLETLRRKEVVEPEGTYWIDEPVFRFHHALIRDAAYRRLLKEARAELHARFADWLAAKVGALVGEHEEVIGYHLEQAHEYRRQLGPLDDEGVALGQRAAHHLAAAARRALERDDLSAAAVLTARALERLPDDDVTRRAALLLDRCEALVAAGEAAAAIDAVSTLRAIAADDARLAAWADCFAAELRILTESQGLADVIVTAAAAAATLAGLGDSAGAAKAHAVHARALSRLGRVGDAEAALDRALTAARDAGDRRRANAVLMAAPVAALWGPSPVARASGRCLDVVRVLRITSGAPAVEATALRCQAVLEGLRGRYDAARRLVASARSLLQDLGLRHALLETDGSAGLIELLADNPAAAEVLLRAAYDGFRALGASTDAAQAGALLARAVLELGRDDEAEALTVESEQLSGDQLKPAIAWRAVRAEAMARRGAIDDALVLAYEAVALAEPTDALIDHADARAALAAVLRAAGRDAEADEAAAASAALLARKEAQPAAPAATITSGGVRTIQPEGAELSVGVMTSWRAALMAEDWPALGRHYAEDFILRDHRAGLQVEVHGRAAYVSGAMQVYVGAMLDWDIVVLAQAGPVGLVWMRSFSAEIDRAYLGIGIINSSRQFDVLELFDEHESLTAFASFDGFAAEHCPARFAVEASGVTGVTRWVRTSGDAVIYETADALVVAEARDGVVTRSERIALDDEIGAMLLLGEWQPSPHMSRWRAEQFVEAFDQRDWECYRRIFTPDMVTDDRRSTQAWPLLTSVDDFIARSQSGADLAPDLATAEVDWLLLRADVGVVRMLTRGHHLEGGGDLEIGRIVLGYTEGARVGRLIVLDYDDVDGALALARGEDNLAVAHFRRGLDAFARRDWDAVRTATAERFTYESRRPMSIDNVYGVDGLIDNYKAIADLGGDIEHSVLATRGRTLALFQTWVVWNDGSRIDVLQVAWADPVTELGARTVSFELDDLDAAYAELDAQYVASLPPAEAEVAQHMVGVFDAYNAADWTRFAELLGGVESVADHRLLGLGINSVPALVDAITALFDLVQPDRRGRVVRVVELTDRAYVCRLDIAAVDHHGTPVEIDQLIVCQVERGRGVHLDLFNTEDEPAALALARNPRSAGNLASQRMHELSDLCARRDWAAVPAIIAPHMVYESRRAVSINDAYGVDGLIENCKITIDMGLEILFRGCVSTRGEWFALVETMLLGGDAGGESRIEFVQIIGLDPATGLVNRMISYDTPDLDAASVELDRLYTESSA